MAKLTTSDLTSLTNETSAVNTINNNNALIETALENTLSRDGTTPNTMSADIDLNGNDLLNVGTLSISGGATLTQIVGYAEEWATKIEDSLVSVAAGGNGTTEYSALHWAAKASTSATAASGSASAASTSEGNAATSETNAAASAAASAASETAAGVSETNAAASYDAFDDRYLGSKASDPTLDNDGDALIDGALYWNTTDNNMYVFDLGGTAWVTVSNNATSVAAAASASAASTSASNASTSETNAEAAKDAAVVAQAAAEAALDEFTDTYLGAKASDPTVDNDGNSLTTGDQYFNTSDNVLKIWNGSSWQAAALSADDFVSKTSGTGSAILPAGSTAQRDGSPLNGYLRYNSDDNQIEGYISGAWGSIGGAGGGYFKGENGTVGSSAGDIFRINEAELNTDVTIDAAENASATGPLGVASGVTLTVSGTLVII
jgi:hypothetical protein